ncbi:hypothetical protein [Candidatus Uabimicrobium sp. HlEnr_7]|uniref:hypothetical protein n=1 Tax=Candidatus Uabimicrobium helgolandensis TaxID=3095367 RepID=UPI0035563456
MKEEKGRKNVLKKENSHNFKTKIKVMAMIKLENQDSKFRLVTKGFCTEWLKDTNENREKAKKTFLSLRKYWGDFFRKEELQEVLGIKEEVPKKTGELLKKLLSKKNKK